MAIFWWFFFHMCFRLSGRGICLSYIVIRGTLFIYMYVCIGFITKEIITDLFILSNIKILDLSQGNVFVVMTLSSTSQGDPLKRIVLTSSDIKYILQIYRLDNNDMSNLHSQQLKCIYVSVLCIFVLLVMIQLLAVNFLMFLLWGWRALPWIGYSLFQQTYCSPMAFCTLGIKINQDMVPGLKNLSILVIILKCK